MKAVIQFVKPAVPVFMKKAVRNAYSELKTQIDSHIGILPDFLIIGGQKCGTTSLYNNLIEHPSICSATVKEVGYFDRYYNKGIKWYRRHFPSIFHRYYIRKILRKDFITGEASTGYILMPHALKRISKVVPQAKLILMLRNPVDRAYSHFHHAVRMGVETLSFEEAIKREPQRTSDVWRKLIEDEDFYDLSIAFFSYLSAGVYINQVKVLMSLFHREQILILKSEEFYRNPAIVIRMVFEFLDLPSLELKHYRKFNVGEYLKMDTNVRENLVEYFMPYNKRLYEFLDMDFEWDK